MTCYFLGSGCRQHETNTRRDGIVRNYQVTQDLNSEKGMQDTRDDIEGPKSRKEKHPHGGVYQGVVAIEAGVVGPLVESPIFSYINRAWNF